MRGSFIIIAGLCVVESEIITMQVAEKLVEIMNEFDVDFYFKASFDKANRTSIESFRGNGIKEGLRILQEVKNTFHIKIVTDIHEPWQAGIVAPVCDIIQIPAFLCRQTDLLVAAAKTEKTINIKKAQFLAPWDMKHVLQKVENVGNQNIMLCERGSCFGYNSLVVDMTSIVEMKKWGYPVIFDCTHSVQKPGGNGMTTSGNKEYIPYLAKAAVAVGANGLFFETHLDSNKALSDGSNMIPIEEINDLLSTCLKINDVLS